MGLPIGVRFGPYEVQAAVGAGGMGEVYRARDTKLNRDVALKVLPAAFAQDPERLARFRREAQVLASLNHTNIGAIHGFEESDGVQALVLEYVDGPTLADRLAQGAIPLDEALPIARQVADALEAAHEQGIIHRDLKPANIKVRDDGTVKVLDFGLAKALDDGGRVMSGTSRSRERDAAYLITQSPTIATPVATMTGVILGTAAYMSPEQAKGRAADKRSDIWAFGCVLFEMLAGRRAFDAEDVSDTLEAVLRAEVDWSALPASVPPSVVTLLKRCLDKDRRRRIGDIAVAQFVLGEHVDSTPTRVNSDEGRRTRWHASSLVVAVLAALVSAGTAWLIKPGPSSPAPVKFTHMLGEQDQLTGVARHQVAISPDGTQFVYVANNRLYRRPVGEFVSQVIAGTEGDTTVVSPVFSPDGDWIAYHGASASENAVRRIPITGGSPITVVRVPVPAGMSWDESGIVYSDGRDGIFRVSPNGGAAERLVRIEDGYASWGPQLLPGGEAVLFTLVKAPPVTSLALWENVHVVVQSLTSAERKTLVDGVADARYLRSGHLVFAESGSLFAMAFDPASQTVSGNRVPILAGVRRSSGVGAADFSVSNTGALVYIPGPVDASARRRWLTISERGGTSRRLKLEPRSFSHPRVSPDGARLAVTSEDEDDADILIYELSETSSIRRLTVEGQNRFPVWSFDNERVAFQSDRDGDRGIYWQGVDARSAAERLTTARDDAAHIPNAFSPDGRYLLFDELNTGRYTLHMLSMNDKRSTPIRSVSSGDPTSAVFAPDGRWIAYSANAKSGSLYDSERGVFIQPFPPTGVQVQAPKARIDYHPVWARDGRLFYVPSGPRPLVFVAVKTARSITFGPPVEMPANLPRPAVFSNGPRGYDLLPDGRILAASPDEQDPAEGVRGTAIHVVLNWVQELERAVPTR